ncbi:hypothetical protein [Sphingomonas sp.]|uniref:hypothetical protein n=1 Tax=Sphingomonas sp. TaxID=28214 RepID=UPI0035BBCD03
MTRTLVELLHILAGLAAAAALTSAVAWSYPLGATTAWWCGGAAMVATVVMGVGPLRRAWMQDRPR